MKQALRWLVRSALALLGLAFLILIWGVGLEPRFYSLRRETAALPNLPAEWEGQQVALIADFQVGMWLGNTDTVRRVVARLVELKPAAVLIAGDFIYHPLEDEPEEVREDFEPEEFKNETIEELRVVTELLRPLTQAKIPTYAVLGNHDYAIKSGKTPALRKLADRVASGLEGVGVRVLRNASVPLSLNGGEAQPSLYLVGVDSHLAKQDDVAAALQNLPPDAARLILLHNPVSAQQVPAGAGPLILAGHTHGGQMQIPFFPRWSIWNWVDDNEVGVDGWVHDYEQKGNRLYINRGIGFSVFPIRLNCPPEITLFTLKSGH